MTHRLRATSAVLALAFAPLAWAQTTSPDVTPDTWRQCAATTDNATRLACFDAWAQHQQPLTPPPASGWHAPAASATDSPDVALQQAAQAPMVQADVIAGQGLVPTNGGCRDPRYSEISRFYELETGSDCGTF
ncbi:MAG: phospholipase, partial [Comamonas sp.]